MTTLALLIALAQADAPDKELQGIAARCGSEIPWAESLEAARKLSRDSGKPIAWWIPTVHRSPMDRKLVIEKYMLAGPFMMPRVVNLLSREFIPLWQKVPRTETRRFDLEPPGFVEPGALFLTHDLKVLHKVDGISTFSEEWFVHLLAGVLKKAGRKAKIEPPKLDAARRAIAEGRPDPSLFEKLEGPEARYFHGVALHLAGRDEEGRAEWKKIREGRWAWKAAAELARDGPFVRGFEIHETLPEDALGKLPANTTLPRKRADVPRAIGFLLRTQRASGVWDDSTYNYGGDDSLPNVYMAITALAALALKTCGEPKRVAPALERAERFMRDESNVNAEDEDEIIWAHAYRLLYFARTGDKKMTTRLVRSLADLQKKSGIWRHEYGNPFTTATVLHALDEAAKAGVEVPEAVTKRGAEALLACRDRRGVFSYEFPIERMSLGNAAGRMPFCEFALFLNKQATKESVAAAIKASLEHHDLLERVRKYDMHADRFANAGFFFWYDQYGRALAARAVNDKETLQRQKEIVLETQEIDGCWVDSHELGRVYGTALGLLTLKMCGE